MTAESSSNKLWPHSPALFSDDGNNNLRLQRTAWAQVVRGEHDKSTTLSSSSPPLPPSVVTAEETDFPDSSTSKETQLDNSDGNNSNVGNSKKSAWNKPLNGVVGVGPVMGDVVSWPALSESTKPPPKSTSDSPKPVSDAPVSTSQAPVISHSPQNQRHANTNPNPNFTRNDTLQVRQKSSKRGGSAGGGSMHGGFSRPPPPPPPLPPPFPLFEMPYGALVAAVPDSSLRGPPYMRNNWEGRPRGYVSQSYSVTDQSSQRNYSRRGNFGGSLRGDRLHNNSHKSRRDQDRDWNASRNYNARDVHIPQQIAPPRGGFIRPPPPPPPGSTPFIAPPPVTPFGNPMGIDMTSPFLYVPTLPPESFMGMPFIAHAPPPPMFFPVLDATLPPLIVNQIDYYFSDANLVRDDFLRSKMDDEGWIPIRLIAQFPRVRQLTDNIQLILDSLRTSSVVEVQGNKIRSNEWKKWICTSVRSPTDAGSQPPVESTYNMITTSLQKVTLDESTAKQSSIVDKTDSPTEVVPCRSSCEELTSHSKVANGECINEEACSSQI